MELEERKRMGRKRIEPSEVIKTLTINIKQGVLDNISKEGNPKHIVEKLVNDKYRQK